MTLFPQIDDYYYTDDDKGIKEMMERSYQQSITINQEFWAQADLDTRFRAGDQTLWNDFYGNMPSFRGKRFNFNLIRPRCNMISGYERQHRKSIAVLAEHALMEKGAQAASKALSWVIKRANVLDTRSEAFDGAITTGMNLLAFWMDYTTDPINGEVCCDNVPYNGYLIDPYFKKRDLADCSFLWTRKFLTKSQAKALLPDRKKDLDSLYRQGARDGKFEFQAEAYNYAMQDMLSYDEYWYKDYRPQTMIVDVRSGETLEWRGSEEELRAFQAKNRRVVSFVSQVPTTKLAIMVQGRVMYNGPNPMGIDRYPFVPIIAYYEPELPDFSWRLQGVVRGLRDSNYLYNRRRVIELDILESQINSGWKYKENALVDPKDVFLTGQGKGLALKATAQMTDVEPIVPVPPSQTMLELSKMLSDDMDKISGVTQELLGQADDNKVGILEMLRQGAALTTLQVLFDHLDFATKTMGGLMLDLIQANFTPGKIEQITGEPVPDDFFSFAFSRYEISVEEIPVTETQRKLEFMQLMHLKEAQVPVPTDLLIEAAPLVNAAQYKDAIMQQEQKQSQMQEQQQQMQIALLQAQIKDLESKAAANYGLGIERRSRVSENEGLGVERRAAAIKDIELATLNQVKAIQELQGIDFDNLQKLFNVIEQLKNLQADQAGIEDEGGVAKAGMAPAPSPVAPTNAQPIGSSSDPQGGM